MSIEHKADLSGALADESVVDYLLGHPDFFEAHAELLSKLKVPHPTGTAVSLIERQVEVLRGQNRQLERKLVDLIEVARANDTLIERIHRLALALLEGANLPVFLLANRPPVADLGSRQAQRSYERHWTPVHLDFIVSDLDATVARLTGLGGSLDRDVKLREYGRIANMADPFGNGFDLIEFSGAGYDAVSRN